MNIYIGADHRGFKLKESLKKFLDNTEYEVIDLGNDHYDEDDDYPDFAKKVAEKVSEDPENNRGIVICRSGVGVSVTANKFKNVIAGLIFNSDQALLSRRDDNVNVLALASEFINGDSAERIVDIWLRTPFSGKEKDERRLEKIKEIENG